MAGSRASVSSLAPAKVNLTLRVLGKRADGYHHVESLIVPVSLCDELLISVAAGNRRVTCSVEGPEKAPEGESNLAAAAARSALRELDVDVDVGIRLIKNIPAGSGLGGGSSDAASVLRTLPAMLGRLLRPGRLSALALELGADVPFFLACRPAVAMGIGEILAPVSRFPELNLVVAVRDVEVSTAWAYEHALPPAEALTSRPSATSRSLRLRLKREPIASLLCNDFETGVTAEFPDVARLKRRLEEFGAEATVMSGSGSAVVGLFRSGRRAEEVAAAVPAPDRVYAVKVLRRRPAVTDDGR